MKRQQGAVLILVLWLAIVMTVLVTVMAANIRLSATTAFHHQEGVREYADMISALNRAEMELILERMPVPADQPVELNEFGEQPEPLNRYNGQALTLHYPAPENTEIRIIDHAGKINLNRINANNLRLLIENRLGPGFDPREVQAYMAAWSDWVDLNSLVTPGGGAEDDYYLEQDPPYRARNNPDLESVDEILLIRGFAELFAGVNLDAAFTVYGNSRNGAVNPNLATREALALLPGMDAELIEEILAYRQTRDIRNIPQIGEIIPLEQLEEVSPWLEIGWSSTFSVYVYPKEASLSEGEETEVDAESENLSTTSGTVPGTAVHQIIEVDRGTARGRVFKADPYAPLPDLRPPQLEDD
ncbi:MAG: type II secretion system protein GspK [Pseudohongiella nitratireducens]|nr:type II secretion system protein GspK [Pseudohongiella nitratireducens]MDF1621952.1 type II secretion system protein GspK [Pseudohongiella nitratireducens]